MKNKIVLGNRELFYELSRKPVKNINLRVHPDLRITVSANKSVSTEKIESFILSKAEWILSALHKFESKKEKLLDAENYFYLWGEKFDITVTEGRKNSIAVSGSCLIISLRDTSDIDLKNKVINEFYTLECKQKITSLCEKVYRICNINGLHFPSIKFRNMRSRWGSCNPQKCILTFNTALARLPIACAEYVVFHEFTHFLHPNHSKAFYSQLEAYMPDWKERKHLLNEKSALLS